jgi:hypothetical protein
MSRSKLLIGISVIAFGASSLAAQTTVSGSNTASNDIRNESDGGLAGSSTITQDGNDNTATVRLRSTNGATNVSVIQQRGDRLVAVHDINGNNNNATTRQGQRLTGTADEQSTIRIRGNSNTASVQQDGRFNSSTVNQGITFTSTTQLFDTRGTADRTDDVAIGDPNTTEQPNPTPQIGTTFAAAPGENRETRTVVAESVRSANNNTATVDQQGTGLVSVVEQRRGANDTLAASRNTARVVQRSDVGTTATRRATVNIRQETAGNSAEALQFQGTADAPHEALIRQRNTGAGTGGFAVQAAADNASNTASVAQSGLGMRAQVNQNGRSNNAQVSMGPGGGTTTGTAAAPTADQAAVDRNGGATGEQSPSSAFQGNRVLVNQTGRSHTAFVVVGNTTSGFGRGNVAIVNQGIAVETQNNANNTGGGNFGFAKVRQRGNLEQVTITQTFGANNGTNDATRFAEADTNQFSIRGNIRSTQNGNNRLSATQVGTDNDLRNDQTNAGDITQTGTDEFGFPTTNTVSGRNQSLVAQNGLNGFVDIRQNAIGVTATVTQRVSSSNSTVDVRQGMGAAIRASTDTGPNTGTAIGAGTRDDPATATNEETGGSGANTRFSSATVTQELDRNDTVVRQDGFSLVAQVSQLGSGFAAGTAGGSAGEFRNRITIDQTGTGNFASAYQAPTVRPSGGDTGTATTANPESGMTGQEGFFAGGRRSAEINILQSNSNNSATVEQYGRGQLARIVQSGTGGRARIVQLEGATNATAIIRQSGTNNNFEIIQDTPGQFFRVTQTGNGNTVATSQQSVAGTSTGSTNNF